MKIQISPKIQDLITELTTLALTVLFLLFLLTVALVGFIYPFPTYQYFEAVVEHKNEIPVCADYGGVIIDIPAANFSKVRADQPIITLSNRENNKQSQMLSYDAKVVGTRLEKLKQLEAIGAVSPVVVEEQVHALDGIEYRKKTLRSSVIRAPYSGRISYTQEPSEMIGSFLSVGQRVGFIYPSEKKVLKITASASEYARFKTGASIKLFTRDAGTKKKQMRGIIYAKTINRETRVLSLMCEVNEGYDEFQEYVPGSIVNAGVLVTKKSLFESFFNYDLYGILTEHLHWNLFGKIEKVLKWIQE